MIYIKQKAHENSKKSQEILGMKVWTGYIVVYEGKRYLWSKFSPITSLTKQDALDDAQRMAREVLEENGIKVNV